MAAKAGKTKKTKKTSRPYRASVYPNAITEGKLVKFFYECYSRWADREEAARKFQLSTKTPYVPGQKEFIEESKAHFSNSDFSKANLMKLLGGRLHWRRSFTHLVTLVDCYEHITEDRDGFLPLLPLSSRSAFLQETYGCSDGAWRVINNAMKVGLIACVDDKYWFLPDDGNFSYHNKMGKCRLYAWNKAAQKEIKKLAVQEGIIGRSKHLGITFLRKCLVEVKDLQAMGTPKTQREKDLFDRVRVDTGLRIPSDYTDEEIAKAILEKYPLIAETVSLIHDEINPLIPRIDQHVLCRLKITRNPKSGTVTKIGWRPTTRYVSLRKEDNPNGNGGLKTKKDYLDQHFGAGQWKEWDVKSSVPRLLYALNHDLTWLPCNQVDMYEELAPQDIKQDPVKWHKVYRNQLKKLFLRVNFNYSYKTIFNQLRQRGALSEFIPATSTETAKAVIRGIKEQTTSVLGPTCGSEIFILESYVYLKTYLKALKACKQNGLPNPLLFYDGFILPKSLSFDLESEIYEDLKALKLSQRNSHFFNKAKHPDLDGGVAPKACLVCEAGGLQKNFLYTTYMSGFGKAGDFLLVQEPPNATELVKNNAMASPNTTERQRLSG